MELWPISPTRLLMMGSAAAVPMVARKDWPPGCVSTIPTPLRCGSAIKQSIHGWREITAREVPDLATSAIIAGVGNVMGVGHVPPASQDECRSSTDRPSSAAEDELEIGKGISWSVQLRAGSEPCMLTGTGAFCSQPRSCIGLPWGPQLSHGKSCNCFHVTCVVHFPWITAVSGRLFALFNEPLDSRCTCLHPRTGTNQNANGLLHD